MDDYGPATYGDRIAPVYDDIYGELPHTAATVDFVHSLAGDGRVLELGIGTGRIAIPLAQRGVDVHGIDASAAMVERLRAKPGGAEIPVVIGDFADVAAEGRFRVVFVAFNTFFNLLSQDAQVLCFANVAHRLEPGGCFVVSAFVPDVSRFVRDQAFTVADAGGTSVRLDASVYDPQRQLVSSTHIHIDEGGVRLFPVRLRFAYPPELDLMARLAGLELEARYGSFERERFTATSVVHVSVYRKPAA